nr:C-type lectin domain family 4 member F-like [Drosophila kikkawai]
MHNFGTFFCLWVLAACILWQGSFAKDQSGYICLIDDPKQNQCDSYCLTELSPRLNKVVKAQNKGNTNTRNAANEIKSKLERLELKIEEVQAKLPLEVYTKLEGQLQGVETKLESQQTKMEAKLDDSLLAVKTKLEGQQVILTKLEDFQAKLEASLLAVQTKLEAQHQAVVNQLQAMSNDKKDAAEGSQLQAKSNKTAVPQQAPKAEVPASSTITIPSGFELIETRYFIIVNELVDWETAERRCRKMGGYLASFRNEEEINAITPKLDWPAYWLGINDRDNEGHFVSVASHKPAPFLKWKEEQPSDLYHEENCVNLYDGKMWDTDCNVSSLFICQADNET